MRQKIQNMDLQFRISRFLMSHQ